MRKVHLLIIPDIYLEKPLTMRDLTLQRFGLENNLIDSKDNALLLNVQQMLMNQGYTESFTYTFIFSDEKFEKVILYVRKIMAIFRYVIFGKYPDLNIESLTYYLVEARFTGGEKPEIKYILNGVQDGVHQINLWAPGFREGVRKVIFPNIIDLDCEHFLIQKFNSSELEDKYIIAIERFNRTFKQNYDPVEDILNLTTAFEHIFKLKGKGDKCRLFANRLIQEFGLSEDTTLSKFFTSWSEEFYRVRGEISHGNAFQEYSEKRGHEYWEECFKWKHPDGTVRYINHASIAKRIFQLIMIEKVSERSKIGENALETAPQEVRNWSKKIEQEIMESYVEPLITPNEIYYRRLKELIDSREPFGRPYYSIISRIKQQDGTEEKAVLLCLLKHFSNLTEDRFPDLKQECGEMKKLIEEENIAPLSLKAIELSQKIYRKDSDKRVIDDEKVYNSKLSQLFEKVFYSLSQIAWLEKLKSSS
jgi:hypothetical protein